MNDVVLVTGGSGFIGTWVLRELLARQLTPVVFDVSDNPQRWQRILGADAARVVFVPGSLLDRDRLRQTCDEHRVTHFIHLAALLTPACQRDPWAGCQVNVLGGVAIFEEARRLAGQIRGISYASSIGVFGPEPDDVGPDSPGAENQPPNFYGAFKKAFDIIAEQYWRHFGVASVGIRPSIVYGPERDVGLTAGPSLAARAAAQGEPFTINYTGQGGYDYVEDVASAFVRTVLETPRGANLVELPSELATVEELIAAIKTVVPKANVTSSGPVIPAFTPPHPRSITSVLPDWRATPLPEGMRKTIDFYRSR